MLVKEFYSCVRYDAIITKFSTLFKYDKVKTITIFLKSFIQHNARQKIIIFRKIFKIYLIHYILFIKIGTINKNHCLNEWIQPTSNLVQRQFKKKDVLETIYKIVTLKNILAT